MSRLRRYLWPTIIGCLLSAMPAQGQAPLWDGVSRICVGCPPRGGVTDCIPSDAIPPKPLQDDLSQWIDAAHPRGMCDGVYAVNTSARFAPSTEAEKQADHPIPGNVIDGYQRAQTYTNLRGRVTDVELWAAIIKPDRVILRTVTAETPVLTEAPTAMLSGDPVNVRAVVNYWLTQVSDFSQTATVPEQCEGGPVVTPACPPPIAYPPCPPCQPIPPPTTLPYGIPRYLPTLQDPALKAEGYVSGDVVGLITGSPLRWSVYRAGTVPAGVSIDHVIP